MTYPLTKEEHKIVDRVRHRIREDEVWGGCDTDASELLAIIDNLSKRVVKKYSGRELMAEAKRQRKTIYDNPQYAGWIKCARFLGALEENE